MGKPRWLSRGPTLVYARKQVTTEVPRAPRVLSAEECRNKKVLTMADYCFKVAANARASLELVQFMAEHDRVRWPNASMHFI